jgi:Mg2+ and Co2+ transporter CorA
MEVKSIIGFVVVVMCFLAALWGMSVGPDKGGLKIVGISVLIGLIALVAM